MCMLSGFFFDVPKTVCYEIDCNFPYKNYKGIKNLIQIQSVIQNASV